MAGDENPTFDFAVRADGPVAHIDLNRPDEGNALTRDMMVRLAELIRTLAAAPDRRAVAISARGPVFCRGRDARGESRGGMSAYDARVKLMGAVLGVYDAIGAAPVPVVACVQGPAIGFGAALAGGCDVTLAADTARFSFPEIEHGIPPTLAISAVMRKMPPKTLSYLIYSAKEIDAREAVGFGLASAVFPAADFAGEVESFLASLAARPRLVLETIKRFQTKAADLSADMASEYAGTLLALVRTAG
jgi:enoyl-CoA hydratase/carnithine racemase